MVIGVCGNTYCCAINFEARKDTMMTAVVGRLQEASGWCLFVVLYMYSSQDFGSCALHDQQIEAGTVLTGCVVG